MARILIIDDDPYIRKMYTRRLSRYGYELFFEENGAKGVHAAIDLQPELIIMDLYMPVKNGFQAIEELRELGYQGIIMACSASVNEVDSGKSLKSGADIFIPKPITRAFEASIANLLTKKNIP